MPGHAARKLHFHNDKDIDTDTYASTVADTDTGSIA